MHTSAPVRLISGFLFSIALVPAHAADSVEQRLQRIENLLGNQVLMEQSQQMEMLRQELAEIREMVENQDHQLNLIKQRQRNLYQDMDRRLHDLEAGTTRSTTAVAPAPVAPPNVAPPRSVVATPTDQTSTAAIAADTGQSADNDGKLAYGQAFNLLKEGRYQQAVIDFRNFLQNFPESRYRANAQYWLAEANYVSRDYKTALQEFQKIVVNYPDSNKIQGAELKIGYTYYEMQDWASARTALERVMSQYPNTTVAKKAAERLDRMKREGR